jgi:hypothetical protein
MRLVARGWESKSVESQMQDASAESTAENAALSAEERERERQRAGLLLARTRVQRQLDATTNPRYAEQLRNSLAELDERLAKIPK